MSSAEQDQWKEICAAVRAGLAKQVEYIPAMETGEVASLVEAINTAIWNESRAAAFDEEKSAREAEMKRQQAFGG